MTQDLTAPGAGRSLASAVSFSFWHVRYSHPALFFLVTTVLLCAALVSLTPDQAHALEIIDNAIDSVKGFVNSWVDDFWSGVIQQEFDSASDLLQTISVGQLANSFDRIFVKSDAYSIVTSLHATVVNGLAYSVLAIVFLVQTVRIANKMDGNQAVPGVKEMIFLLIFFVIGKYIIDNSLLFCEAVYNVSAQLISQIDPDGTGVKIDMMTEFNQSGMLTYEMHGITGAVYGLFFMLSAAAGVVVAYLVVFARGIQIYLYTILAPIPLALLLCDETRQMAMGFIKNFLGVCFAGFIIVVICKLYPALMQSILQGDMASFAGFFQGIACILLFLYALIKSGSWARDIFGG